MADKKLNKTVKLKKNILWVITAIGVIIGGVYTYYYSPGSCAYRYLFAYNKSDFEKAISYYNQEAVLNKFSQEEIIQVLKEQAKRTGKIKVKELTMIKDNKTKRWSVKFPYDLQSIYVFAPTGSNVYINQKKVAYEIKSKGIEVKDMLPGKYQVTIEYYNKMYPNFTTEIYIPNEVVVASPYHTHDIAVFAPVGTWVKVGDIIKHNKDGKLVFGNMLLGQYNLSVWMDDKEIEVFSQNIQIDNKHTAIHIENIRGNTTIKKDLEDFFNRFNIEYRKGIINKDTSFLHKFSTEKIDESIITDFKMWYIDHKEIKDAKTLMEVRDIYPISGNQVKASVLETVYLTDVDKEYRIVIEWDYKLFRNNATWQIFGREILQSIVAYKNEEGNWVKY